MTYKDLQRKVFDKPFRSFRIRLVNNTTYDVTEPWMVWIGETKGIIAASTRTDDQGFHVNLDWRTVSIEHMLEFQDLDLKKPGQKKRPA